MKYSLLLAILLFLTACSNLSPAIKNAPKMNLKLEQVQQNASYYEGSPVRWGGTIIEVENNNDSSRIQILSYPLNYYGRPQLAKKQGGRFIIQSKKFLDPAVYKKDAEITVAGILYGKIEQLVGKKILKLPLITVKETYLWPVYQNYNHFDYYNYGYYRPYYRYRYGYRNRFYSFPRFYYGCY
ncbi:MAG: hypothetical protein GQ569_03970 [Methylococcaceae bacterium]|nr:hypothetical protein [Methylococcaceae bacterium]